MAQSASGASRRQRRRIGNYLLDRGYQLKYAGYLAGVAAVLSIGLGTLLWRTSQTLVAETHEAVRQGEQVVKLGREVATESRKVTAVVQMTMEKTYADDPELLEVFKKDSAKQDEPLKERQKALEAQTAALEQRSAQVAKQQRTMLTTLVIVLALLVLCIGLAGIVVTHRVAGPIYKMTRQIKDVTEGDWTVPASLRKGDELVGFFEAFRELVQSLRDRRTKELAEFDSAIEKLEPTSAPRELGPLRKLRDRMSRVLQG